MISIVIIHYNGQILIERAINSILTYTKNEVKLEFLIIDNSQNLNRLFLTNAKINFIYHDPGYNCGFARAVNYGIKNAKGDYVLLMNQDASLTEQNTILKLIQKQKELPEKTILGCSLKDENSNFQESVWIDDPDLKREWRFSPIYQKFHPNWQKDFEKKKKAIHNQSGWVHRINGAFLLFKKPTKIEDILFDEDFFLYGEDVEWALRIKKTGWQFYHNHMLTIMHIGGASSSNESIKQMQIICSDWLVVKKIKGNFYLALQLLLILFNKSFDLSLLKIAKWRGKTIDPQISSLTTKNTVLYFYLIKKYALKVLFQNKFSAEKSFEINCYQNDIMFVFKTNQENL